MGRLDGKIVVVTGANSGVGEAACKLFAKEGAKVVLAARRVDKLENVKNEIEKEGGIAHAVKCDISKEDEVINLFKETISVFGQVDVLLNNAGVLEEGVTCSHHL